MIYFGLGKTVLLKELSLLFNRVANKMYWKYILHLLINILPVKDMFNGPFSKYKSSLNFIANETSKF